MTRVLFIRHARTAWNQEKRIQGHTDIPLCEEGRAEIRRFRLPLPYRRWPVYVSPLSRAVETARLLGLETPAQDPRLMEMHYGAWEGFTRTEIAARYGEPPAVRASPGLDFRPDGGESPRELRQRLLSWLDEVRASRRDAVAVTHRGVIRMALSMATGWDLVSKAPAKLRWDCVHLFALPADEAGAIRVVELNMALVPS